MTGVINVGVQLPAVIFSVVIRPSGGPTPLISPSVSVSVGLTSSAAKSMCYFPTYQGILNQKFQCMF